MSDARIPRSYQATAAALSHTFSVMLQSHPEAFDCLIFPAQPSEQNEIIAVDSPTVTLLDRDERAQRYGAPIKARAMLVPDGEWAFGAVDSGLYESFHSGYAYGTRLRNVDACGYGEIRYLRDACEHV